MVEHTLGPWEFNRDFYEIQADQGMVSICDILSADVADWEANARLIAAAPDLLAATEDMIRETEVWAKQHVISLQMVHTLNALRAAVAKARGAER